MREIPQPSELIPGLACAIDGADPLPVPTDAVLRDLTKPTDPRTRRWFVLEDGDPALGTTEPLVPEEEPVPEGTADPVDEEEVVELDEGERSE